MRKEDRQLRITHVITGLETGGAEMMLYKLIKYHKKKSVQLNVVSLTEIGPMGEKMRLLGIPVYAIGVEPGSIPSIRQLVKLVRVTRNTKPDVLQGWMYHANVAATVVHLCFFNKTKLFWNIRQSIGPLKKERPLTKKVILFGGYLSRIPDGIIYNSRVSAVQHKKIGFSDSRQYFIPNGFELEEYSPRKAKREFLRRDVEAGDHIFLVAHVARLHPKKDHHSFLRCVYLVAEVRKDILFLAAGRGVVWANSDLRDMVLKLNIQNNIRLLGERSDIAHILASVDLLVSSSAWGEGFPNIVGEAMASATPCVVTDVGESANIVADTGYIVSPERPEELATSILNYVEQSDYQRMQLAARARSRIGNNFSMEEISQEYLSLYMEDHV